MKKTRFLVLALAVAIMLMGAGYAYWQETLSIENTITTGKLDFAFDNPQPVAPDQFMADSSCVVRSSDNNFVDITLAKMYPGAEATVTFDLKNTGTMAAVVKGFAVTEDSHDIAKNWFQVKYFKVGNDTIINDDPVLLKDLATQLANKSVALEPDQVKTIIITFEVNENANEQQVLEGQEGENAYKFGITATGYQYNYKSL